jgi:hypothetical protein
VGREGRAGGGAREGREGREGKVGREGRGGKEGGEGRGADIESKHGIRLPYKSSTIFFIYKPEKSTRSERDTYLGTRSGQS